MHPNDTNEKSRRNCGFFVENKIPIPHVRNGSNLTENHQAASLSLYCFEERVNIAVRELLVK